MASRPATTRDDSLPGTTSHDSVARMRIARSPADATLATSRPATATASTGRSGRSPAGPARHASPNARRLRCLIAACLKGRLSRPSRPGSKATGSVRPNDSPGCIATRSCGWRAGPGRMPRTPTTSWSPFPARTREVQPDEKGSLVVAKEQAHGGPDDPADDPKGDWWDPGAYDAEHRLVLAVVPGPARSRTLRESFRRSTTARRDA